MKVWVSGWILATTLRIRLGTVVRSATEFIKSLSGYKIDFPDKDRRIPDIIKTRTPILFP